MKHTKNKKFEEQKNKIVKKENIHALFSGFHAFANTKKKKRFFFPLRQVPHY